MSTMAARLPVEVVTKILSYLSVSDRKEAALVNHLWHDASLDPVLLRDTVITFPLDAVSSEVISNLAKRQVPNLVLQNIDGTFQSDFFLKNSSDYISNNLIRLSLKGSSITEAVFIKVLSKCHSLESLDLSCCNSLFMTGVLLSKKVDVDLLRKSLRNVKELNLSSIRYLSDSLFRRMISVCLNLEKLYMANNQIVFHTGAIYKTKQSSQKLDNTTVFTFAAVLAVVEERATKITALSFSRTTISEDNLECLAMIPDLVLEELYLVNCQELDEAGIIKFCKHQKGLLVLDMSQCMMVKDRALRTICSTQAKLHTLSVSKLQLSDDAFSQLHKLGHLQNLNLSSCHMITHKALSDAILNNGRLKLAHLDLNCCSSVKDPLLMDVGKELSQLTSLDLSSTGVTNWSIVLVSKFMTHLRCLRLAWCRHLTDSGLLGIIDMEAENHPDDGECRCHKQPDSTIFKKPAKYRQLTSHTLQQMEHVLKLTGNVLYPLSNLAQLQKLDLTACTKITDHSLGMILPGLLQLQTLNLAMCSQITNDTLYVIAEYNVIIEELDVSNCLNLTDEGMMAIARQLRRLTHLNISNCDGLSDESIHALRKNSRWLKCLNVSMNVQMTQKAVGDLECKLKHLQKLNKRLIDKTTNDGLTQA